MNEEGRFKAIVDDATVYFLKDFFENKTGFINKCNNRIVEYNKNGTHDFDKKNFFDENCIPQFRSGAKKVVIILESPHKDEYENDTNVYPICANGTTGYNLKECLSQLIGAMKLKGQKIDIAVINAIPYQCSQGVSTEILRDFVWLKCWYDFGYTNLLELLRKTNPDYIVNCCTIGSHTLPHTSSKNITKEYIEIVAGKTQNKDIKCYKDKNGETEYSLRGFVNQCIANYAKENSSVLLYQCTHPCTWKTFKKANFRKIELN